MTPAARLHLALARRYPGIIRYPVCPACRSNRTHTHNARCSERGERSYPSGEGIAPRTVPSPEGSPGRMHQPGSGHGIKR